MPNSSDKNVVRLCAAINGFRLRFGEWPSVARLWPGCIDDLRYCLSPEGFANVQEKLRLVESDGILIRVEDNMGRSYDYESEGFPEDEPDIPAEVWLQAERRRLSEEELKLYRAAIEEMQKRYPGQNVIILPD